MVKQFLPLIVILMITLYLGVNFAPKQRVVQCSIAEITPDYSVAEKEACRKARMSMIKNQ